MKIHQLGNKPHQHVFTKSTKMHHQKLLQKVLQLGFIVFPISTIFLLYTSDTSSSRRSLDLYCSKVHIPIFSHTLERKWYMFLICNIILVFITKTFGPSRNPPSPFLEQELPELEVSPDSETESYTVSVDYPLIEQKKDSEDEDQEHEDVEDQMEDDDKHDELCEVQEYEDGEEQRVKDPEATVLAIGHEEKEEEGDVEGTEEGRPIIKEIPRTAQVEENEEVLNTDDDLNRKFDEFIRKMKEELRLQAQWLPVEA